MKLILLTNFRKLLESVFFVFLALGVFFSIWNVYRVFHSTLDNFKDGRKNIQEGLPFFFGERMNKGTIIPAMKVIAEGAAIYYWTIPELEKEVSHECRAYEIAYYLFPSRVGYKHGDELIKSDFIICEAVFASHLERKLSSLELSDARDGYSKIYSDDSVVIYDRKSSSFPPSDHMKCKELAKKRMSVCELSTIEILSGLGAIVLFILLGRLLLELSFFRSIRESLRGVWILPLSFTLGGVVTALSLYYSLFAGMRLTRFNCIGVLLSLIIFACLARYYFQEKNPRELSFSVVYSSLSLSDKIFTIILLSVLCLIFCSVLALAFSVGANDAAGQAVWGMKVRSMLSSGTFDLNFMEDHLRGYSHPDYPPAWTILLSCISLISCDSYNEIVIKILPITSFLILCASLFVIGVNSGSGTLFSLVLTVIFAGNQYLMNASATYYAESFLGLCFLWGFFFFSKYMGSKNLFYLFGAFLFFGFCGLVKNEGVAIFAIASFVFFLILFFYGDRAEITFSVLYKQIFCIVFPACSTFVTWLIFVKYNGIQSYDFDLSLLCGDKSVFMGKVILSFREQIRFMLCDILGNNAIFYFSIGFIVFYWDKLSGNGEALFLLVLLIVYISTIGFVFGFSTRRIDWHLRALPRVLILCNLICALMMFRLHLAVQSAKKL